jgi:hypothetical protein
MGHKARKIFCKRLSIVIFYPALDLKNLGNAIGFYANYMGMINQVANSVGE